MAEECLIDNNSNNNKMKFVMTSERLENYFREERIRRHEEEKKREAEGTLDYGEEDDEEEYKELFRYETKCLVKPYRGHEPWFRPYKESLAPKKAAAATSVNHDDEALQPKKKLKVNEQEALEGVNETSTQKDNNSMDKDGAYEPRK